MQRFRLSVRLGAVFLCVVLAAGTSFAAPYAAMVMDARSGEVLHSRNADTQLHPASLTKMMTLYIAFEAVRRGEITLDTKVRVSSNAAAEPPSKLYLKAGQTIELRYLIRAAAVKSANDAATAIGEAISGSEAAFARRMNRTAKAMGMRKTSFRNANGLTEAGHLSTARDMTLLGRHLLYDYPEYYNLFSRRSTDAKLRVVSNTNRRLLDAYRGADGIKTGYTRAAGFNLVASAQRGNQRIIATMFGGTSGAARNARVAELLDMGFSRSPARIAIQKPGGPDYGATELAGVAVSRSAIPAPRVTPGAVAIASAGLGVRIEQSLQSAQLASATEEVSIPEPRPEEPVEVALAAPASGSAAASLAGIGRAPAPVISDSDHAAAVSPAPMPRPVQITFSASDTPVPQLASATATEVMVPQSASKGDKYWGINVGTYASRYEAERVLLKTALIEIETLDTAMREVVRRQTGFEARFTGLDQRSASLACARLNAREQRCDPIGP